MRLLFILSVLFTLNASAQKSGDLEKAMWYASEYNSRYAGGGKLKIEEEKQVLKTISEWLLKLKPYYTSGVNSEKVAAIWTTTQFYRQMGLVYSYFKTPNDPNWLKEGAKSLQEGIRFKNKYYRLAANAPAEDRVDVSFADTAFIDAAFNAYSSIVATRQKNFKLSQEFLKKLPSKPINRNDDEAPIASAYMEFIATSKSTNTELYDKLYKIFSSTEDWFSFEKLQVEAFIETTMKNVVLLKPARVIAYYHLMSDKFDVQLANLHNMYAVAARQFFKNNQYKFDLRKLQEQLKWEDFIVALPPGSDTNLLIKSLMKDLVTTLQKSYPLKPIPPVKGKEDPVVELLNGLVIGLSPILSSEKLAKLNKVFEKHLEVPYTKEAAKYIASIKIE